MILPGLHVIATDEVASDPRFEGWAGAMQERCGPRLAFHLRMRTTPIRRLLEIAERLEEGAVETDGWLVVNRRLDLALVVGAEAVQIGRGALPIEAIRDVAGESVVIGASVHDVREADARRREGADYLVAGSVYETASHPGSEPAGLDLVRQLALMDLPIIAIGGVTAGRVAEVVAAGAHGIAVIRAVWEAGEPVEAAARLADAVAAAD